MSVVTRTQTSRWVTITYGDGDSVLVELEPSSRNKGMVRLRLASADTWVPLAELREALDAVQELMDEQ